MKPATSQTHRGDADKPSPTRYVAVAHHDPKSGFRGEFVAETPASRGAAAKFKQKLDATT